MKALTKKIWLYILTVLCVVCCGLFAINALGANTVQAASSTVTCQGIANDVNNNILETTTPAKYRTLLAYDVALGSAANTTNVVSTTGQGITLNGVKLSDIPDTSIDYAHGSRYIQIKIPQDYQDALTGDIVLEVIAGTTFESQVLDGAKFALKDGKWKKISDVAFTGIQWNNIGYGIFQGKAGVLLNYSAYLSTVADEINGGIQSTNFASTVGEHIYLNGAKLSTLPGALVAYHSQDKMFVYADNMSTYRKLTIEAGAVMLDSVLPETNLYFNSSTSQWQTNAPTNYTSVTFTAIQWNNIGYGIWQGKNGVLLTYSANLSAIANEYNGNVQNVNFAQTVIGEKIKLGGVALKDIAGAEICYHSQGHLWIYAPNMTSLGNLTVEETNFLDVTLPDTELTFNGSAWEVYAGPTVTCQGIANDLNNNILEESTPARYRTLLAYDVALGSAANTTNVVATTGQGILLNGVKLSEIEGASIDYAHGSKYIQIKIPQSYQDALEGDIVLEVLEDTKFENQFLDYSKFILRAGMWVPYSEPTAVTFTGIQWNNIAYGIFEGKLGVLLSFNTNLSKVQREIDAGIQSANFASTVGETIYLNGAKLSTLPGALVAYHSQNFMFVYADNMSTYRTLTIESGTVMMDSVLPEVELYFNGSSSQWSTTPISYTSVTLESIAWNNIGYGAFEGKGGVLLRYSANLSAIANEYNGNVQNVNFAQTAIGEKIKLGGVALKDIEGAEICYHSQGHLWIYAPNMTTLGNLTIAETNFLDVTLPDTELTFNGSAWEVYVESFDPTVVTQGIANDLNNNIASGSIYYTLIAYDLTLGTAASQTNVVSTTGEGILLNGVKLSEIAGASVDYGHGSRYIQIKIPQSYQDSLEGEIVLEVLEGTKFENQILDYSKFILREGFWVPYTEPSAVSFTKINWNNIGYAPFEGKAGVLLAFNTNLSKAQREIDGGIQSANFASTVGENIYLNGVKLSTLPGAIVAYHSQNFMFVYADNMTTYRTLTVEAGTVILDSILPEIELYFNSSNLQWQEAAPISYTSVTLESIEWNNIGFGAFEGKNGVLLTYSAYLSAIANEINAGVQGVNLAKTAIGEKIKLGGVALKDIEGAEINYHSQGHLWIYAPDMTTLGELTIEETNFLDATLPDAKLTFNGSAWEIYVEKLDPTVVTQGIANDDNNNVVDGNTYRTLIKYDVALGTAASQTNVVSTVGEGILLNGVKLSEIEGASIDYGHGNVYIQIRIPQSYQDALEGEIVLEVLEGTKFENQVLDYSKFTLKNGRWVLYVPPYEVDFTGIQWNDTDYGQFDGKKGVLLAFSTNLSTDPNEYNGGMASTNMASTVGEYIYLGGVKLSTLPGAFVVYHSQNFMFVYADNMATYRTLTVEGGTQFFNAILPEINLYYTVDAWTTEAKSYPLVEFTEIQWNNIGFGIWEGKEGVLVSYSANLSSVNAEFNAGIQGINFVEREIGEKIKLGGVALKDIEGAEICYHSLDDLWIYTPDMAERGILTIEETIFLDVTLPELTLYFKGSAWTDVALDVLTINYTAGGATFESTLEGEVTINADYLTEVLAERYEHLIVLSWTIGETSYFYGETAVVNTTTTITITEVLDFYTMFGASIRISNDGITGLRFGSSVGLESYNALYENYSDVELGTYIAPKVMLGAYLLDNSGKTFKDYFAQEQGSGNASKYVKVVNSGIYNRDTYESDGYVAFYGSLSKIHEVNYYTEFVGVGYIKFVKDGNTYVIFGASDLADTTRTIYDIAVAAYNDRTASYSEEGLTSIKAYIDAVVNLTYKGGELTINEIVTGHDYASPYQASYSDGYYYVARFGSENVPKVIIINGKKVSSDNFNVTTNDGSLVMSISASDLAALFADGVVYGVGEPDSILWENNNTVATADMLSGVTGALNATAFRVWLSNNVTIGANNEVSLNSEKLTEMFKLFDGLANNGVKEVYIIGQVLPSKSYTNFYVDGIGWVTSNECYTQYSDKQFYMDYSCVPDPLTEAAAYAEWLKLQYDYYTLLTAQIAEWQNSNPAWQDVRFYFEGLNEPEGQLVIHKRGSYDFSTGTNNYEYFTSDELARILTDVAYYMTLAVKTNLNQKGYVTSPALMYLTSDSGNVSASGVSTDGFLNSMAAAIKDSVAPTAILGITPANTNYPEDYFTVLNWHPYLAWSKSEHNSLYYAEIKSSWTGNKAVVNSDYATDWVNWNNNLYNLFVDQFDGYAPKVVFTEFGVIDYGEHVSSYAYYKAIGVDEELAATVFANLLSNVGDLAFANNCTIIAFRLCDLEGVYKAEQESAGYLDIYVHGEGNLGLIEEDGTVKAIMREYYYILNGTRDTTALQEEINKYYD